MLEVTRSVLSAVETHAARTAPDECCGLLLGRDGRIDEAKPASNVANHPRTRFEIDPAALIAAHRVARAGGPRIIGYYHSHPDGHPLPSAADCEHLSGDGRVWAIVAAGAITFWRDDGKDFAPLSPCVIDG